MKSNRWIVLLGALALGACSDDSSSTDSQVSLDGAADSQTSLDGATDSQTSLDGTADSQTSLDGTAAVCPNGFCTPPGGGDASVGIPEAGVEMICNIETPADCGDDEQCLIDSLCYGIAGQVDTVACTYSCAFP